MLRNWVAYFLFFLSISITIYANDEILIVEKIIIKGNSKTDTAIIKQHIPIREKEPLDEEKVEFARLRLLSTGFFSDVFARIEKGSKKGFVNLVFEVKERGTLFFDEIHLGLSSVNSYWGGLSITDSNFWGRGYRLSIGTVYGEHFLTSRLKFLNPSIFGSKHRIGFEILYNDVSERTVDNKTDEVIELLQYRRLSGTFIHGLKLEDFIYGYFYFNFEGIDAKFMNKMENDPLDVKPGRSYLSSLSVGISKDKRNDVFMPNKGYMISVYYEIANGLIFSDYEYAKLNAEIEYLLPSFSDHSFKVRLFAGSIQGDAPFFKKFFVGDYFYFVYGKTTLPRIWGVNTSDVIKYKTVAMMGELSYAIPSFVIKDVIYKSYFYFTLAVSHTASIEEFRREEEVKATEEIITPLSFDIGFKADTEYGILKFSTAYFLDVFIDKF
ncbi:MAG: BamA/TamA family outer membrane protein [Deltaproteobacteria bacterium]|nr:BamA/TamA family outer membrane protein [Deltaproteobacteria bacterium]